MADTTIKFLSYDGLQQYDGLVKQYVNNAVATGVATSFKGVSLSDGKLQFWTELPFENENGILEGLTPAYEITLPKEDLTHFMELVDGAVEGNIATFGENGQVIDGNVKLADIATKAEVKEVADALDAYEEANDAAVKEVKEAVEAIEADYLTSVDKTELSDAIAAEKERAEGIEGGLETRLAAVEADYLVEADKTELANAIKAITDDYLVEADKTALQEAIDKVAEDLVAEAEVARAAEKVNADAIAAEKERAEAAEKVNADAIAAIKEDVDAFFLNADMTESAKDTLKELQEYIASDETGAAAMAASIKENADDIDALEGRMDTVEGAVATKAEQADLEAEVERATKAEAQALTDAKAYTDAEVLKDRNRLDALEAKFDGEDSVADQIADALEEAKGYTDAEVKKLAEGAVAANAEEIAKINDAETGILKQAKDYVDGKDSAMNARVEALEAIDHDHDNKDVLDGITAEQVEAWDAAEQNAKDYVDGLNTAMDARVKVVEEASATHAKQADLEAEVQARKDADAAIEAKIGEVAEGKTVVGMIADAQAAATYDDEEVRGLISDNADAIDAINNEETGILKQAKDYTDAEVKALADSLVEISTSEINALFGITE